MVRLGYVTLGLVRVGFLFRFFVVFFSEVWFLFLFENIGINRRKRAKLLKKKNSLDGNRKFFQEQKIF